MKKYIAICFALALVPACGNGDNNEENNAATNNTATNNAATNNTATNNAATNNAATNNAATNNAATNNAATNNAATNNTNSGTSGDVDFIEAEVDGEVVRADAEEGGVEPMVDTVQLRKTTGENSSPIKIYRLTVPNTDVASYDCASDDVTVIYSELNGQLVNNWTSSDTCSIDITEGGSEAGDVVVGTFSATTSDGGTTVELTNGSFRLTR